VPASELKALEGWLEKPENRPTNWKVTPSSKELPQSEEGGQPMVRGGAATRNSGSAPLADVVRP